MKKNIISSDKNIIENNFKWNEMILEMSHKNDIKLGCLIFITLSNSVTY